MRAIDMIVVHCTATREGQDFTADHIRQWHLAQGWSDIGYHFCVRLNGIVEKGRPEEKIGSHAQGFNTRSIGVVYVGGLDRDSKPKDTRTGAQKLSLEKLLRELKARYPGAQILGHRDLPRVAKACPCFHTKQEYASL